MHFLAICCKRVCAGRRSQALLARWLVVKVRSGTHRQLVLHIGHAAGGALRVEHRQQAAQHGIVARLADDIRCRSLRDLHTGFGAAQDE